MFFIFIFLVLLRENGLLMWWPFPLPQTELSWRWPNRNALFLFQIRKYFIFTSDIWLCMNKSISFEEKALYVMSLSPQNEERGHFLEHITSSKSRLYEMILKLGKVKKYWKTMSKMSQTNITVKIKGEQIFPCLFWHWEVHPPLKCPPSSVSLSKGSKSLLAPHMLLSSWSCACVNWISLWVPMNYHTIN